MAGPVLIVIGLLAFVVQIAVFIAFIVIGWIDAGRHMRGEREILSDD